MVGQVWWYGRFAVDPDEGAGGGEPQAQQALCRGADQGRYRYGGTRKKTLRASRRREVARWAVEVKELSIRLACEAFGLSLSVYRYQPQRNAENQRIAGWLTRLTDNQRKRGYWFVLFAPAQLPWFSLEPQARVLDLPWNTSSICASSPRSVWSGSSPNRWQCPRHSIRPGQWTSCTTSCRMVAASGRST